MLTAKQIDNLRGAIKTRSILDLSTTINSIPLQDLPEACTRVAYDLYMSRKGDASKFNLDKLSELWEAAGFTPAAVQGVIDELRKLLAS